MSGRNLSVIAVCLAVVSAAVAAVVVSLNRAEEARAYAEAEAAAADAAELATKTAKAQEAAETAKREAAEAQKKAKADELAAQRLATEKAASDEKAQAAAAAAAEAKAREAAAKAESSRLALEEARKKAQTAKSEADRQKDLATAESARAEAETSRLALEKMKKDNLEAETKLIELRKLDFASAQQRLVAWEKELDERARALAPEKTIADLNWAGGMEDSVLDEEGNVVKQEKRRYDPETDPSLPFPSRMLAKRVRIVSEAQAKDLQSVRASVVGSLERLYVQALKDGRTIDAQFYRKNILSMYPDWKFTGEQ